MSLTACNAACTSARTPTSTPASSATSIPASSATSTPASSATSTPASIPARIRIAITTGEPAGIGPELCGALVPYHDTKQLLAALKARVAPLQLTADTVLPELELVLIGDYDLLQARMALYGAHAPLPIFDPHQPAPISILPQQLRAPAQAGKMNPDNAAYVKDVLDCALRGCTDGTFAAMVTAPISKSIMIEGGMEHFTGHTEYLQEYAHAPEVVMVLGCDQMNVALVTTHLPLSAVPAAITPAKLSAIVRVLQHDLHHKLGFENPKIYVCGLNPHAGEDGTLGREELDVIIPTLEQLRAQEHMNLVGPLPADTIFQAKYLQEAAAILAMYHDQGLPVLKYAGFETGYNTTLGLPFIRTSVDHGTALDLAGTGTADPRSLINAVSLALYQALHQSLRNPTVRNQAVTR